MPTYPSAPPPDVLRFLAEVPVFAGLDARTLSEVAGQGQAVPSIQDADGEIVAEPQEMELEPDILRVRKCCRTCVQPQGLEACLASDDRLTMTGALVPTGGPKNEHHTRASLIAYM